MKWRKLGRVFVANGEYDWAQTHAYVPTPLLLDDKRIRVYAAFLDEQKVGRIGFVDVDANNPLKVLKVSKQPVLDIGDPGTFDDSGVTPIQIVRREGKIYMYYMGWQLGVKIRYFLFAGLAIGEDGGGAFKRYSRTPILDRTDNELFVRSALSILKDDDVYKTWYVSSGKWINIEDRLVPTYNIRYIESNDGIQYNGEGDVCLDLSNDDEYGFGRPQVIKEDNIYKMFYSIRTVSRGYRIGYAESRDGLNWVRKDNESGIDVSQTGWDSEMICFASIVDVNSKRYMFYNGNNYGETGFGVAKLGE